MNFINKNSKKVLLYYLERYKSFYKEKFQHMFEFKCSLVYSMCFVKVLIGVG